MVNPLALNDAELEAPRALEDGTNQLLLGDPVLAELHDLGLVEVRAGRDCSWALTMRGRLYPTD
ncbi:MAG TPA: hypothetical protein VFD90_15105 [Gaiellales bacterium]|nr:hypothetical protein [Gaiellales bacterium]